MVKKDSKDDGLPKKFKMTPEDYWEWKAAVSDVENAKLKSEIANLRFLVCSQKVKLAQYEAADAQQKKDFSSMDVRRVMDGYQRHLVSLEEKIGTTIKGKIINPVTYEVLDDEKDLNL